jgi:REP element-mobilizing transposase RayT
MTFNPDIHHRRSIRLRDYDYSQVGAYFVTICAWQRECLFGEIVDGEMRLNEMGRIICAVWNDLPNHYRHVELDEFVAMPNHVHGIIVIVGGGFETRPKNPRTPPFLTPPI